MLPSLIFFLWFQHCFLKTDDCGFDFFYCLLQVNEVCVMAHSVPLQNTKIKCNDAIDVTLCCSCMFLKVVSAFKMVSSSVKHSTVSVVLLDINNHITASISMSRCLRFGKPLV